MSATNRRKGHQWERDVAAHLRDILDVQVRTGRDAKGGAQTPGDLQWRDDNGRWWPGLYGWTLELKNVKGTAVPTWLGQAREAAGFDGNEFYGVVRKVPRKPVGDAQVLVPRGMIRDYLIAFAPRGDYSTHDHVGLSLDAWLEVVS